MSEPLGALTVHGRLDRVRTALVDRGLDALVVTAPPNIRWCVGFTGSAGVLVVRADGARLFTDSRYATQAPAELEDAGAAAEVVVTGNSVVEGAAWVSEWGEIALEADAITWAEQRRWAAALGAEPRPVEHLITELRSVKDDAELARMQRAAAIVDDALADVVAGLVPGTVERDLALAIDDGMRARGASGPAYETIVASGPNSARPHARPGDRAFREGDLVVIDAGATVDGYRSDMTRTFVIGAADERAATIHDLVTRAQAAGVAAVRAGVEAASIDDACRSLITDEGFGPEFGHGTGHGVGLDIHELPAVRAGNAAILQPGHVITVEPGIYLPGVGGVRVEDMVVVTADGCRSLTRHPKLSLTQPDPTQPDPTQPDPRSPRGHHHHQ